MQYLFWGLGGLVVLVLLMQDKYTWGDDFIAFVVGGREGAIPIELRPF